MASKMAPPEPDLPHNHTRLRKSRPLWRLFGWGSAATIALTAVAFSSQTDTGSKRLHLALGYVGEPAYAVAAMPLTAGPQAETQRLAEQVRELSADRERLTARIATLERNLDDMTGSIKLQAAAAAAAAAAPANPTTISPPPVASAPATAPAVIAILPPPASALPPLNPLARPVEHETAAAPRRPAQQAAEPLPEPIPLPPVRVAAVPLNEPVSGLPPPLKPEYGIDLGGASSVEALRIHWASMKANFGPLLGGLHPAVAAHPRHPSGVDYRLLAGPLPNIAAAAQLCARFQVTRTGCRPTKFNGPHLAEH